MRFLLLLAALTSQSLWAATAPEYYKKINNPEAQLTVINPFFSIGGVAVNKVIYSIDNYYNEISCTTEDRNGDGKTCGKPIAVGPGPHIISVVLCSRADCFAGGKGWNSAARFVLKPREQLTLDVKKLIEAKAGQEASAFTGKQLPGSLGACGEALENSLFMNTCSASGIKVFQDKLAQIYQTCKNWTPEIDLLLSLAVWETSYLSADHCYLPNEMKKWPDFLARYSDGWPQGTIERGRSSWDWARSPDDFKKLDRTKGEEFRRNISEVVKTMYDRQVVIDQLIAAVNNPKGAIQPILAAAKATTWNVNPSTIAGHRDFVLSLLIGQGFFGKDQTLANFVAENSPQDTKIHCSYFPEIKVTLDAILLNENLSDAGWKAVQNFITRTPKDKGLQGCDSAFYERIPSPVTQLDRLRFLAQQDCSADREASVRGSTIRAMMQPNLLIVPKDVKATIRKEFAGCIPPDTTVADQWKRVESDIKAKLVDVEKTCGKKIEVSINKASFGERDGSMCNFGVETIQQVCQHWKADELKQFAPKIKAIVCVSKDGELNHFSQFKNGTFTFTVGADRSYASGIDETFVRSQLKGTKIEWE